MCIDRSVSTFPPSSGYNLLTTTIMAKIGVFCPPLHSHLQLNATLGRALQRRGHSVFMFQLPGLETVVEALGIGFRPLQVADITASSELAERIAQLGRLTGMAALRFTFACAREMTDLICRGSPQAVKASGADLLIVDQNEPAGASVAEHLGIPFVSVCNGLPLNREPLIPPPVVPWAYHRSWWGRCRNAIGYAVFDRLVSSINAVLNEHRRRWGLSPVRRPDDTFSRLAQFCPLVEEFDFPRQQKPESLHYLGPFIDAERPKVPFPYERLDGRPLIYASLGTIHSWTEQTLRALAEAVAPLEAQLIAARARAVQLAAGPLPGSPILAHHAPQCDLLARASLFITHAGLNSTLESLASGTPMIAVPITNDQPPNAARIVWSGTGEVVPFRQIHTRRFGRIVRQVFEDPKYRANAQRLQGAIRRSRGAEAAADLTERILNRA